MKKIPNEMEEIAQELIETIKWIPLTERKSKTYLEYLDKISFDIKLALENEIYKENL